MTSKLKVENQQKYNLICFYNFVLQIWVFVYFSPFMYIVLIDIRLFWLQNNVSGALHLSFMRQNSAINYANMTPEASLSNFSYQNTSILSYMYVPKLLYSLRRFFGITIWTFPALCSHFCAASNITGLHFRLQIS